MVLCFIPLVTHAQSFRLKAFGISYKVKDSWGGWSDWTDWKACNIDISVNFNTHRILIFSKETQDYAISEMLPTARYDENGKSVVMRCVDDDGLICILRLRSQYHPDMIQLYIEYSDMIWVYNVEEY
ncbi:hypothetical protein [Parabacteroides sp. An277]|uniref:hypothetical protein n=1 Tax=Parabacteroides sp. An277 TaxID=1965619 RepID=UPI001122920A|nr:hypothetical protein [Parabacteroides sp. An277]